jgi:large subunit ribosomal protein L18
MDYKRLTRLRRKKSIRKKVKGTDERPRLCVFRSAKHIYAQIINDNTGSTLIQVSTLSKELRNSLDSLGKKDAARKVGELIAKKSVEIGIKKVVFDRNGFLYHGRIRELADSARENGLEF